MGNGAENGKSCEFVTLTTRWVTPGVSKRAGNAASAREPQPRAPAAQRGPWAVPRRPPAAAAPAAPRASVSYTADQASVDCCVDVTFRLGRLRVSRTDHETPPRCGKGGPLGAGSGGPLGAGSGGPPRLRARSLWTAAAPGAVRGRKLFFAFLR